MRFLDVSSLDDLASYFGFPNYEYLTGLLYPRPVYTSFKIPKKSGGFRTINSPNQQLKKLQQKVAEEIRDAFGRRSPVAHSFIKGRSIVSNALPHVGRASVVRVDLADFFGQIHFGRVQGVFKARPFTFPNDVATVLAQLCCYQNKLPQGAPTSAALTNFVCLELDSILDRLARRYKARYSRYADDLTFSFKHLKLEKIAKNFLFSSADENGRFNVKAGPVLIDAIRKAGFEINSAKTNGANRSDRQLVAGLLVNNQLSLPRKYVDAVRRALFIWEKAGLVDAEKRCVNFLQRRRSDLEPAPKLVDLMRGKLNYLSMVKGKSDATYLRLAIQFNELLKRDSPNEAKRCELKIDLRVQTIQDAIKATWYLLNGNMSEGTAFRFEGGYWVTCAHCVGDIRTREAFDDIVLTSGDWKLKDVRVRIVDVDFDRDIAILRPQPMQVIPRNLPYFVAAKALPKQDDRVGIVGFPAARANQPPIFMRARILRCRTKRGVSRMEIDKQILKGNSGGPLFDESYNIVGIVVEGAAVIVKEDEHDYGENASVAISELSNLQTV